MIHLTGIGALHQAIPAGAIKENGRRMGTIVPARGVRQEAAQALLQAHIGSLTMILRIMMILQTMPMMPGEMILTAGMMRMIIGRTIDDGALYCI